MAIGWIWDPECENYAPRRAIEAAERVDISIFVLKSHSFPIVTVRGGAEAIDSSRIASPEKGIEQNGEGGGEEMVPSCREEVDEAGGQLWRENGVDDLEDLL